MALELQGKFIQLLEKQSGAGKNGSQWEKQDFIVETMEQYPKKVCISAWGDKVNEVSGVRPGDVLKVSFNVESREYNGRWYTDLRAWRISREGASQPSVPGPPSFDEIAPMGGEELNDLPF